MGRQALWPGRRFSGISGTVQAHAQMEAVQLDPLNIVARSHDIAMYGRVLDYRVGFLEEAAYQRREMFDYGGGLFMYPMAEMPAWRPVMERQRGSGRWAHIFLEQPGLREDVLGALRERGPLGNRDFSGNMRVNSYRGRKDTALALFDLWLTGDIMIHHRRGFDRYYDLLERVLPSVHAHSLAEVESDDYFARKAVAFLGLVREKRWAGNLTGYTGRKIHPHEASNRIGSYCEQKIFSRIQVEGSKESWLVLESDLSMMDTLESGNIPLEWQVAGSTTLEEVTFLAPLEIVSARGRAREVFDFDYVWEVYKPLEQRRWGYYTLPILFGDKLVARLDPRLDRKNGTLKILGFWLEDEVSADDPLFADALRNGLRRFASFLGARAVDVSVVQPGRLRMHLEGITL